LAEKDVALAILGAAIGLAGLLLVFAGFLLVRAAEFQSRRGDIYRIMAKAALAPLLAAFTCTALATWASEGGEWAQHHLYLSFYIVLVISAVYAIIALLKA
jgi:hypothetical protein